MLNGHGDDAYKYQDIQTNFSSNVYNHFDQEGLFCYLADRLDDVMSYPEPTPASLEHEIASYIGLNADEVMVTNGATEAIYLTAQTFRCAKSAIVQPTFSEYADACRLHEHRICSIYRFDEIPERATMVWLCNPNNPTGHVIPKQRLLHDIASHPADIFVIDSSYAAYTDQDTPSALDIVSHDNAIMLCSMTKDYGVPGLRLGYIIANSRLLERVNSQRMPWSVNTLAIEAGKYLIAHCVEFQFPLATLLAERQRMEEEIHEIGILTSHSDSHMLLCQLPNGSARELKDYLANHHGILIRDASNFPTLTQQHFRIAVQTPDDNNQLISALKNYKSVNCK